MVIIEILRGQRFAIYALGRMSEHKHSVPYLDLVENAKTNQTFNKEFPKLIRLLDFTKENGLIKNTEKYRILKGWEPLAEFKTFGGLRLFVFPDGNDIIICANYFLKQSRKTPTNELEKAKQWMRDYFLAKNNGTLIVKYKE